MKLHLLLLICLIAITSNAKSQAIHSFQNLENEQIKVISVLEDNGYDFQQILRDTSLNWVENKTLTSNQNSSYWIKCKIKSNKKTSIKSNLLVFPFIQNTLFYFDIENNTWNQIENGLLTSNKSRSTNSFPISIAPNTTNIFYFKINLNVLKNRQYSITPSLSLKRDKEFQEFEQTIQIAWLITFFVLVIFIIYSIIILIITKDVTYFYYILILIGGGVYTTAYHKFFNSLIDIRAVSLKIDISGTYLFYFDFNAALSRISAVLIAFGFVQLTRSYLLTKDSFPILDRILKILITSYFTIIFISVFFTFFTKWYIDPYLVRAQNIVFMITIGMIIFLTVKSYSKSYKPALYFLLANIIPLIFVFGIAFYFTINNVQDNGSLLLPYLAVISMTLTFAFALAGRFYHVREELSKQKFIADELQLKNDKMFVEKRKFELENKIIQAEALIEKAKTESLQNSLEEKQRELVSSTLHKTQNRQMLEDLKKHIDALSKNLNENAKKEHLKDAKSILNNNIYLDSNWDNFKLHFEEVHPNFFSELKEKFPMLTSNELRLCAYLHINLSVKEIAALQNIDPASVRKAKSRLKKKMNNKN